MLGEGERLADRARAGGEGGDGAASVVHGFVRTRRASRCGERPSPCSPRRTSAGPGGVPRRRGVRRGGPVAGHLSAGGVGLVARGAGGARDRGEGPHVHDVELTPGGVDVVN
ncbi:hypothetical protein ACFQV4_35385 [Streptomyces thermocarboxydus]